MEMLSSTTKVKIWLGAYIINTDERGGGGVMERLPTLLTILLSFRWFEGPQTQERSDGQLLDENVIIMCIIVRAVPN